MSEPEKTPPGYGKEAWDLALGVHKRPMTKDFHELLQNIQDEARSRDDDIVNTGHLVLGMFSLEGSRALAALSENGVTRESFTSQLVDEEGPSPVGKGIELNYRALMCVGLGGGEADRLGAELIAPEHLLLGVIRESEKWESLKQPGPQFLRQAAEAAGSSLSAIEASLAS